MKKFLSAYSNFFKRIRRLRGKCLSAYGEYGEFRVVCGTQNSLRIRGKNLCVHGEDAKRQKTVNISFNSNTNLNFFKILSIYTVWDGLNPKTISYDVIRENLKKKFFRISIFRDNRTFRPKIAF